MRSSTRLCACSMKKGFRATSIDQVAIALNVTKPTIYHYFSNKDEILFECVRKGLQVTLDAAQKVEKQGGNGLERLKSLIHDYAVIATEPFGKCVTRTADHDLSEASRKKVQSAQTGNRCRHTEGGGVGHAGWLHHGGRSTPRDVLRQRGAELDFTMVRTGRQPVARGNRGNLCGYPHQRACRSSVGRAVFRLQPQHLTRTILLTTPR